MQIDISKIEKKPMKKPPAIIIYGEPGVGKTTFAISAPDPFVIDIEKGASYMEVARVQPESYEEIMGWLEQVLHGKHAYKTLVLDSLDWLEMLIHKKVCADSGAKDISDKRSDATSYGRGHIQALRLFLDVRNILETIRTSRNMAIIITAQTLVKRFDDPIDGGYDRYVLKTHEKMCAAAVEWADAVMFAKKEARISGDGKKREGERVLITHGTLSAVGKSRLKLPPSIPLSWDGFVNNINKEE